ncbi:MAG: hypothetical protein ACE5GU_14150, partial [Candidatus Scalinduaceae bacterium]
LKKNHWYPLLSFNYDTVSYMSGWRTAPGRKTWLGKWPGGKFQRSLLLILDSHPLQNLSGRPAKRHVGQVRE